MRQIVSSVEKEFKLIFRNGISLYMAIAPALLALIFVLVFGMSQSSNISLAVDRSLSEQDVSMLEAVADIEIFESTEKLKARVLGPDSVAGVTKDNNTLKVIVEGNEGENYEQAMQALVKNAMSGKTMAYRTEKINGSGGFAYRFSMICVFLMALFIGGATLGLGAVDERESGAIRAIAVSPVTIIKYISSKLIPAMLIGVVGSLLSAIIIGKVDAIPMLFFLCIASIFVCGFAAFVIPAFAANQVAAIGVLKLAMPLMLVLPISAIFVPQKWQFLYYIIPMYWQYKGLDVAMSGGFDMRYLLLTLVVGFPWFLAMVIIFSKKTKIKFGGK